MPYDELKASPEFCDDQVLRLQRTMPRFKRGAEIAREYSNALLAVCRSNAVARLTIDDVLESCVDVPSIADIRRMAAEHNPPAEKEDCPSCAGTGWVILRKAYYEGAGPCPDCRLGKVIEGGLEGKRA